MSMIASEIIALEKRNERISAVATTIIMLLFLLSMMMWWAYRQRVPPPGEIKQFEVLGSIDFGDYKNGSRNINNFERAVENPTPPPPQQAAPPVEEAPAEESNPTPIEQITNPAPSPVSVPKPEPVKQPDPKPTPPKPVETPKPTPPKETPTKPQETESTQPAQEEALEFDLNDGTTGSNQGDSESGTGNSGSPDVPVINPDALYTFGTGTDGGVQGRSWLNPSQFTKYDSQEEGEVLFEFTISPSGRVIFVRPVGVYTTPELVRIGKERIEKFRFSALPPGSAQVNQKVRYKIRFKLN
jgi:outer membrane biosynthesis protein TonB